MPVAWDEFEAVDSPASTINWDDFEPVSGTPVTPESFAAYQATQKGVGPPLGSEIPLSEDTGFTIATGGGLPGVLAAASGAVLKPVGNVAASVLEKIRKETPPERRKVAGITETPITGETPLAGALMPGESERGVIPSVRRFAAGLTTPGNVAAIAAAPIAPQAVSGLFLAGVPQGIQQGFQELSKAKTPEEYRGAVTDLALNIGMGELMRRGLLKPGGENARSQPSTESVPQSEVRPPVGEETPLRQQGEVAAPQIERPVGRGETIAPNEPATEIVSTDRPLPNARLAFDRPIQEPYSDKYSVSLQVTATEFPEGMRQRIIDSLPKDIASGIDSIDLFTGEIIPTNKAMSVPARVQLVFKNKASAESAITFFKQPTTKSSVNAPKVEPSAAAAVGEQLVAADKPVGDWEAWVNKLDELTPLERERAVKNLADATPEELERWKAKLLQVQFLRKMEKPSPIEEPAKPVTAKPADIISRLESLKFKETGEGLTDVGETLSAGLNLPHPEVLKAIGKDVWNGAIDVAIAGIKAGKEIKLALDDAFEHIRKNATGKFDETLARNNLESIFPKTATSGENVKMRSLSERGTTSETIPEPVQEQIAASPESYYRQQSLDRVEERVRGMSESDLATVPKESDIYTAAKLEQATRLFNEGKSEQGYRVFQDLSTELTRLGQVINQAKLFQALRPEHVVTVVNKELAKAGRDPLTPEQAGRVTDAAKKRIDAQAELNKATNEWKKNPTDENAAKAEKALDDANKAALEEQTLVNQFKPRTTAAVIKSILQGNLLTPLSQSANLIGNINFMPFRSATRTGATAIDMLDSAIRNRPRQVSESVAGTKASVEGLVKGLKQIPGILARGSETIKGESRAGLHPLRAWVKQFSKNPDVPTIGGKIPFSERVNLAIEGTFGVPAEIMLRGLGAGDIGFSEMARGRLISEQSRLQNLPAKDAKLAQKFPELFFDRKTLDLINNETRGAVFQRHSKTLDHFLSWIKGRGDLFDLAVAFVAPYKLTPWNIVGEILSYNPLIAMGRAALEAKRGNIRSAEMNASKALVGSMLVYAGYWLYEKGLIAPSMDSRNEQQKARILAGEVLPPNHINLSGLNRALSGGDPTFKAGDETVDVFRGGGLAGSMFYMMANIGRDSETQPEADNAILSVLKNSTIEQARFGLNQSFLKGVTGLLDAVREGEADNYVQSVANTVLSIPLPNTLSAISRAEREYKVDTSDTTLAKQVSNVVKTRLGFAGMDDYLPLKRGLWGEPMPETPKDRNALVYHFFDISKNRQVTSDPVPLELYRLWRKTANTSVIPTPPDKTITANKQTFLMTPEQRSRLAELVGTERRNIASQVVVNPEWHKIPDEAKLKILDSIYDRGLKIGKSKFLVETQGQLTKKPEKVGFQKTD